MSIEHNLKFFVPEHLKDIPMQGIDPLVLNGLDLFIRADKSDENNT